MTDVTVGKPVYSRRSNTCKLFLMGKVSQSVTRVTVNPGNYCNCQYFCLFIFATSFHKKRHTLLLSSSQELTSPSRISYIKAALISFAIFKGKHILQYSQENTAGFQLHVYLSTYDSTTSLKRDSNTCFPVDITKFFRTAVLKGICEQLPLPFNKAVNDFVIQ